MQALAFLGPDLAVKKRRDKITKRMAKVSFAGLAVGTGADQLPAGHLHTMAATSMY